MVDSDGAFFGVLGSVVMLNKIRKKPKSSLLIRKKKELGCGVNEWQASKYMKGIELKNSYNKIACILPFYM